MSVYVNRPLDAKTLLDRQRNPIGPQRRAHLPYVVNVIPQTFFVRCRYCGVRRVDLRAKPLGPHSGPYEGFHVATIHS